MTPSAQDGSVLVKVSPEILERMKLGDVEPVVILSVQEQDDGTYDMTLMTPEVVAEDARLRAGIQWARGMCSDGEPLEVIDAYLGGLLR